MNFKHVGENAITMLVTLMKTALGGKVDKVDGKGLSTNDYTTEEKNKLAGIAESAQVNVLDGVKVNGVDQTITDKKVDIAIPTKTSDLTNDSDFITLDQVPEGAVASTTVPNMDGEAAAGTEAAFARGDHIHPSDTSRVPTTRTVNSKPLSEDINLSAADVGAVTADEVETAITEKGYQTSAQVESAIDARGYQTANDVDGKISAAISTVYKPQGSSAFAELPAPAEGMDGYVYNVTDSFTTTDSFVEGAGSKYPAGSNVVIVKSGDAYKFDVLAGFVDLSGYVQTSEVGELTNEEITNIWNSVSL